METLEELVPFVREIVSQKPNRGLLKVYVVGSVLALLGTVIGLVETMCHPFSSGGMTDADIDLLLSRRQRTVVAELQDSMTEEGEKKQEEEKEEKEEMARTPVIISKMQGPSQRISANRLHAS